MVLLMIPHSTVRQWANASACPQDSYQVVFRGSSGSTGEIHLPLLPISPRANLLSKQISLTATPYQPRTVRSHCAVICGADAASAIETYGCAKYEWLKMFLEDV